MTEQKHYYWLKLQNTYFNQLEQKKMRRQENGKDMQIIYLRMMLLSLDKGGYIYYQGVYDTLEEELAEEFAEDVAVVKETIQYLLDNNMISLDEKSNCFLPQTLEYTGSECYSAERVRRHRDKKALQCNNHVTKCNDNVTPCNQEKEIELELDKEIKKDNIYCPNFETLWAVYPRKTEKAAAYKAYRARLNDGFSENELLTAVKNYAAQCEKEHREKKYIKHCKTFLGASTPFIDYMKGDDEGAAGTDAESWPTPNEMYAKWFDSMSNYGD